MKVEAAKFARQIKQKQDADDQKAGVEDKNWAEGMDETFEKATAPKEVQEFFTHLDEVPPRKAVFVMMDGTVTEPVGPKDLATSANEADGAIAIIYNGTISDKTLDIASEAAIETVVGTKEGKGYGKRDDVQTWLTEVHR